MSQLSCDVVVVGTELCGLAAAALVAHTRGRRVVVVEDGDPQDALPLGDRLAPTAPTIVRLSSKGPTGAVIDTLGLKQDATRVMEDAKELGVIDDPDIRMVVPPDSDRRMKELVRVFGSEGGAIHKILAAATSDAQQLLIAEAALIHQDGFFEKRAARKRFDLLGAIGRVDDEDADVKALASHPLGVAMEQLVPFVQSRPAPGVLGYAGHLALLQLATGAHSKAKGGLGARAALRDELLRQVAGHGGEVLKERIDTIEADGKHLTRIRASGANEYVAKVVIDATSRRDLTARLPESRRREKLEESERRVQPSGEAAVARWLVPRGALPRPLPEMALVLRGAPRSAVLVGQYAGAPLKQGQKGGGLDETAVAVVAGTVCNNGEGEASAQELHLLLEKLLPFAKSAIKVRDIVIGPAARAALPRFVAVDGGEHLLGGRRPRTPFANLVRAGRDLVPGLGLDGEIVAAKSVAAVVEEELGSKRNRDAA